MKTPSVRYYKVLKVFNNNVLLVSDEGVEKILCSKGIGFGKKINDLIPTNLNIEKVYCIEDKSNAHKFNQLMGYIDSELIGLCEEIICMMSRELNEELNEKIHISLIDHIAFALNRLKKKDEILNPFLIETETLYKQEFEVAKKAIKMLEKRTGIPIPDGEIGFITLHIHSARQYGRLSNTLKYTFLSNKVVNYIESELVIKIDRQSIDYARFITHLRFAIERIMKNTPIKNDLLNTIRTKYNESYKFAEKVSKIIEEELHMKVAEDEVGYLAIYIEKLKNGV